VTTATLPAAVTSLITPARIAVLATILTAVLAGWNLGARSLWLDEAYTVEIAGGTWAHLWQRVTTKEPSMAFYYVLMHGWMALGRDEATLRTFSMLIAVAVIPLAYVVGARLVGAPAAAIGVLLLSLNPFFLRYAQEARAYSLVILLALAACVALLWAIERPTVSRWTLWSVCATLLVYTHPLTLLVVGAQVAGSLPRAPMHALAPTVGVVALLVSPIVWFMFARDTGQLSWVLPPDRFILEFAVARLTGIDGRVGIVAHALCALAALWRGGFGPRFLLVWAALPVSALFAVSFIKPLFIDRYLLMVIPAVALLAGAGLATVRWPAVRALAVAALLVLQVVAVRDMLAAPANEEWRGAAAIIRADMRPDDASACYEPRVCICFDYYLAPAPDGPPQVPLADAVEDPAAMTALATRHPRLWLAVSHADVMPDRVAMLTRIEAALETSYVLADRHELTGVSLRRYDRLPAATAE
jgi:mannosyltransferase